MSLTSKILASFEVHEAARRSAAETTGDEATEWDAIENLNDVTILSSAVVEEDREANGDGHQQDTALQETFALNVQNARKSQGIVASAVALWRQQRDEEAMGKEAVEKEKVLIDFL